MGNKKKDEKFSASTFIFQIFFILPIIFRRHLPTYDTRKNLVFSFSNGKKKSFGEDRKTNFFISSMLLIPFEPNYVDKCLSSFEVDGKKKSFWMWKNFKEINKLKKKMKIFR